MCSDVHRRPAGCPGARRGRGLSIIEVMVGLVVALLVSLAVVNTAIGFTASQRQGIAVTGAAVNANSVLAAVRDDIAVAGLGFFGDSSYLCRRLNFSNGPTLLADGTPFSPLQTRRTAAGDTLDLVYGTRVESGANVRLKAASDGSRAALESYLPVADGDAVLLAPAAPSDTQPCLVRTVTDWQPSTPGSAQQLIFGPGGAHNGAAFSSNPGFGDDGRVTQLGKLNWVRYRVQDGQLLLERPLLGGPPLVVARNVIAFRLQYGVAAAAPGSTTLESWVDPTGAWASLDADALPRVRAVRLGLIVRSPQAEKRNAAGDCTATETRPALWGAPPENLDNPDWACWRYRTAQIVVPLRNLVLGQQ
jgi:type IV pilus assembly protein PilW